MRLKPLCAITSALVAAGCGKSATTPGGPSGPMTSDGSPIGDGPGHTSGMPGVGGHGLAYYKLSDPRYPASTTSISTPKMTTSATGSTIVVSIGRGDKTKFALASALPTDNMGNAPYQTQGEHAYSPPNDPSGTALYTFTNAHGGTDFQITTGTGQNSKGQLDEITIAAVEVIEGARIVDLAWNEAPEPSPSAPVTSQSVTTTGAATLVAFWWGEAFPRTPQSATPGNDFSPLDSNAYETDSFVQCAVAAKNVSAAGTYNVTWTSDPPQGAQLWLVAIQ